MDTMEGSDVFDLRHAATDHVTSVTVPARRLFAITGFGPPRSSDFTLAVTTLVQAAGALREILHRRGISTGSRPSIEVLWSPGPEVGALGLAEAFALRDGWRWEQVLAIPGVAEAEDVQAAVETVRRATGRPEPLLHPIVVAEGPAIQLLQVGGRASEAETLARLLAAVADAGLASHAPIHQIYLSGPDTIGTDRQRSILRVPVGPRV
jgi:hypothetical protein